jgi:KUP system potassium uptake protein
MLPLALGALGVVYGDIGTSPLYAVKECFHGLHGIALTEANVLGVLSLIFWSLVMVVSLKYVAFILRADNKGEGGIFALLELLPKSGDALSPRTMSVVVFLALFGSALLYGDGIITPAISVLSAIEGLEVATEAAAPFILPLTVLVLFGLFFIQKWGTAGIGRIFGPVMIFWFIILGALGLVQIIETPQVLAALNPAHAVEFFVVNRMHGLLALGSVVLCITGGEALYADMGHFGRGAIRVSWMVLVFPALVLNYLGQGAGLLSRPDIVVNPFYGIIPPLMLYPMVALSTLATVIASQAMISGVFSLTRQAVQLGYCPRVRIVHTSSDMEGQIYIPEINTMMMWACIGLVLAFRESSRLAGAYGIAVTATMGITSVIYFVVLTRTWKWPLFKALPLVALFLAFDLVYFGSNLLKVLDGGWFTLAVAAFILSCMVTWKDGRKLLWSTFSRSTLPLDFFLSDVGVKAPHRVPGTAVFMTVSSTGVPLTLLHFFKHNRVLHEQVLLVTLLAGDTPYVPASERLVVRPLGQGFYRLIARYGFMETPKVPELLDMATQSGLSIRTQETTYFLGRETLLTTGKSPMMSWRKGLFAYMSRNAPPAVTYFGIPPDRVMELGVQVEI